MGSNYSIPVLVKCEKSPLNRPWSLKDYNIIMHWNEEKYCKTNFKAYETDALLIRNLGASDVYFKCPNCKKDIWYKYKLDDK